MRRALTLLLFAAVCLVATAQIEWVRLDTVAASAAGEGIWRMAPAGAIFSIAPMPGRSGQMQLSMLYSDDLTIPSGTAFGTMTPTAKPGVYEASLMLNPSGHGSKHADRRQNFTIEMDAASGRLIFKPYKSRLSVNFHRLIPYLFRFSVRREDTRPDDIDGAYRLAPDANANIIIL